MPYQNHVAPQRHLDDKKVFTPLAANHGGH